MILNNCTVGAVSFLGYKFSIKIALKTYEILSDFQKFSGGSPRATYLLGGILPSPPPT